MRRFVPSRTAPVRWSRRANGLCLVSSRCGCGDGRRGYCVALRYVPTSSGQFGQDLTRPESNASMSAFWLGYSLPDFAAAVGALIDEVDLCHAPMGLDVSDEHRQKSQAAGAENRCVLSGVVLDISWHVGSPSPRSAVISAPSQLTAHHGCASSTLENT